MELNRGDLVKHKFHDNIGFGFVLSPTVFCYGTLVCSVQWVFSGYVHTMDISYLNKINEDKKCP